VAESVEGKIRLVKLAKELNVSIPTIAEFLEKKGHKEKLRPTSTVDEALAREISVHFKKDKETAERHQQKVRRFREQHQKIEKKAEEAVPAPAEEKRRKERAPKPAEKAYAEAAPPAPALEVAPSEAGEGEQAGGGPMAPVTETSGEGVAETAAMPEAEVSAEASEVEEASAVATRPEAAEEAKPAEKTGHLFGTRKLRGLKVVGRMDLETKPAKAAEPGAAEAGVEAEPSKKKRKKKKKRIREEAKKVKAPTEVVEEPAKKKRRRARAAPVDQQEVEKTIRRTLATMEESSVAARASVRRRKRKERAEEDARAEQERVQEEAKLRIAEFATAGELARLIGVEVAEVISKCLELGLFVSINQRLDRDTITLVAGEYDKQVEFAEEFAVDVFEDSPDPPETLEPRPPVVTIMGHVNHGKTSLLDHIRQSNIVAGEAGGITQHIGAYQVSLPNGGQITFLDTPGHEAFTAMRARGAQLTDIVILVVAGDDAVMPQTIEAINHALAAKVPVIVAINKIDKPTANAERIRQQLSEHGILVEEWGGKYQSVELSAKTGKNVDVLLEKIVLEAEILKTRANRIRRARGAVVEAKLDRGRGVVGTVLVQKGTLRVGDPFVAGVYGGKVRAMFDERGNRVESARPSTPVQVVGFDGMPQAGDVFAAMEHESDVRAISLRRQQLKREQQFRQLHRVTLDDLSKEIKAGEVKDLPIIVKADVDGSVGALSDALMKLSNDEVKVNVLHRGVGAISESDVLLAAASGAVVIGYNVRPHLNARKLAEEEEIDIRLYTIIYDVIDDVRKALEGLLAPEMKEEVLGTGVVRETFKVSKVGTIAGCYMQDGKMVRNNKVRLVRDGIVIFDGGIASLKRFKDDVHEVETGFEFGIGLEGYNDIKVGDVIEAFKIVETKRTLAQ